MLTNFVRNIEQQMVYGLVKFKSHLNQLGNAVFLNGLQSGLET